MIEKLMYIFIMGSVFGWCMETVFRRFCRENKTRRWINPGFLVGPYLPLYGFALCALFLLSEYKVIMPLKNPVLSKIVLLILMTAIMTLLEFIAGMIFVNGMKLKLWDYSKKPLNYKGVICAEFSFYWFVLAAIYNLFVHPYISRLIDVIILNRELLFAVGFVYGVFAVDFCYSIQIAAKIKSFAAENHILIRYEELKGNIRKHAEETREKYMFIFAFRSKTPLNEHLKKYYETHPALQKLKDRVKIDKNA